MPGHPPEGGSRGGLARSAVLGLPAVGRDDGRPAGRVADLLFSARGDRVVGLLLAGGTWWRRRLIPLEEVAAIGGAAVLLRRPVVLSGPGRRVRRLRRAQSRLIGLRVLSADGHDLGVIDDVCFVPADGAVTGFLVSAGVVSDALEGKRFLPASAVLGARSAPEPRGGPGSGGSGEAAALLLTAPWPSSRG